MNGIVFGRLEDTADPRCALDAIRYGELATKVLAAVQLAATASRRS